jgi:RNA polymerase sigma-70 factor (ECF subfamily)
MSFASMLLAAPSEARHGGPAAKLPELLNGTPAELVVRLRDGDERAFDALYRAFYPRLVAIARMYVTVARAEELAQDVLALVWERRATWPPDDDLGVYLYASVRNRARSAVRHDRVVLHFERRSVASGEVVAMGGAAEPAESRLERADVHAAIDRALARLPDGMRTAFTLRWIHELSYTEVARIMGIQEAAARKQVSRARDAIVPVLRRFAER